MDNLHSTIMEKFAENENLSMSDNNSSYWHQMLHEVLSENLSENRQSLSQQLREDILGRLDAELGPSKASFDSLHDSIKSFLYHTLSEHGSIYESRSTETKSRTSSSKNMSESISSDEKSDAFPQKLRNLTAHWDIGFVERELERLCEPNSVGNRRQGLFESKVNDKFSDEYNLEYADMTFLERLPKNFIVFSKPGEYKFKFFFFYIIS